MENRFLPRFFLLIFCTLYVQNVLGKYPNLLTREVKNEPPVTTSGHFIVWRNLQVVMRSCFHN